MKVVLEFESDLIYNKTSTHLVKLRPESCMKIDENLFVIKLMI
jgi:hypothetical protein